jgi:hypothetical protein
MPHTSFGGFTRSVPSLFEFQMNGTTKKDGNGNSKYMGFRQTDMHSGPKKSIYNFVDQEKKPCTSFDRNLKAA